MKLQKELYHHGIKGQKWGVQNGPPYPLRKIVTRTSAKDHNDIYNTLSIDDKRKLTGLDKDSDKIPDTSFTTEEQLKSDEHIKTFMAKYKDVPISSFSIWNSGKGEVELSLMTRSDYQGKGYGTLVVKRGMEWIDNNPDIMTAYWDVRKDNTGSIALAKRSGFRKMSGENPTHPQWTTYRKKYNRTKS